jgi:hypothetical protein
MSCLQIMAQQITLYWEIITMILGSVFLYYITYNKEIIICVWLQRREKRV